MTNRTNPAFTYIQDVLDGKKEAPKYVVLQCKSIQEIVDGKDEKYEIDTEKIKTIENILRIIRMPKGFKVGQPIYSSLVGFQWFLIIAALCIVYKNNPQKRRYETVVLEICRKNGKTFIIAVLFILLFFLEPKYSYFYSVAPDGALSREIKKAIEEIIGFNTAVFDKKFKVRRDDILCLATRNDYVPLNYSNSRLDGRLPNVFLVDEAGALPNPYAIESMRSGQLTVVNKLGCIISTKYPTFDNPFEDEVAYCKKVLDKTIEDEAVFSLLYEPDNTKNWTTDDTILLHGNPLAAEENLLMDDLYKKRKRAIIQESTRENFLCKHCNIIYQGIGTESFISVSEVKKCRTKKIDWNGQTVYVGVDLAMTNDNCAVSIVGYDFYTGKLLIDVVTFIPESRIDEKNQFERINYYDFIVAGKCIACGDMIINYKTIEDFVFNIEDNYNVNIAAIGYDRYNALSSAQKWESRFRTVEVPQGYVLHPPTKLLYEKIINKECAYENNKLLEINFQNAKCTYDSNMNRYIHKKKSKGKVDMVMAIIDAIAVMQADNWMENNFTIQTITM